MVTTLRVTPEILSISNPSFENIPQTTVEETSRRGRRLTGAQRRARAAANRRRASRRRRIRRRRSPRRNPSRARARIRARARAQAARAAAKRRGIRAKEARRRRIIRAAQRRATRFRTISVGGVRRTVAVTRLGAGRKGAQVVSVGIKGGRLIQRYETVAEQRARERRQAVQRRGRFLRSQRRRGSALKTQAAKRIAAERSILRFGGRTGTRAQRLARGRARIRALRGGRRRRRRR